MLAPNADGKIHAIRVMCAPISDAVGWGAWVQPWHAGEELGEVGQAGEAGGEGAGERERGRALGRARQAR